jgi:hypothetical protein
MDDELHRGDVGTVIHLLESMTDRPAGFIIEFADATERSEPKLTSLIVRKL